MMFGWTPNYQAIQAYSRQPAQSLAYSQSCQLTAKGQDTFLWQPLLRVAPNWRRGSQGIGDCVSWGAELAATMLLAIQDSLGVSAWIAEAATEPIYGGARVEASGGNYGGWSDGSWGAAAAEWLKEWGVLLRIDYSAQTGDTEHDLRIYSSQRAKNWGNYGCGGQRDERGNGRLDAVARQYPVRAVARVDSVDQAAGLIEAGYPITIASNVGFGRMVRDSDGVVRRSGSWAHQMMLGGVRYRNNRPQFRVFQSWGDSASGPDPGIDSPAVSACSWWITSDDASVVFSQEDSWAFSDLRGFPPKRLDWRKAKVIA